MDIKLPSTEESEELSWAELLDILSASKPDDTAEQVSEKEESGFRKFKFKSNVSPERMKYKKDEEKDSEESWNNLLKTQIASTPDDMAVGVWSEFSMDPEELEFNKHEEKDFEVAPSLKVGLKVKANKGSQANPGSKFKAKCDPKVMDCKKAGLKVKVKRGKGKKGVKDCDEGKTTKLKTKEEEEDADAILGDHTATDELDAGY